MNRLARLLAALLCLSVALVACDSQRPAETPATPEPVAQSNPDAAAPAPEPAPSFFTYTEDALDPSDKRLAVVLHGYGADEQDLVPVARRVGLKGPLVGVRAPERAGKGWAWFPINFRAARRYAPDAADDVLKDLAAFLNDLRKRHPDHEVVVLGFSQGAMMAMMLAVEHPEALDRAIALSGTLPRPVKTPPNWNADEAPLIYAIHGTADAVVSLERARQAQQWLEEAGAEPTYMEYDGMAHTIGPAVVFDLQNYLRR